MEKLTLECSCPSSSLVLLEQLVSGVAGDDSLTIHPPLAPGSDYTPVNSAQFLSSINTRQCVNIAIAPDNLVESSETFVVELSSASDAITLGVSMGTVTIIDDDTCK